MTFLSKDMSTFEHTSTKVAARPMPRPFMALEVVASVGQVPSTNLKTGLFVTMPFAIIEPFCLRQSLI